MITSPGVVLALLIIADLDQFNRSWRTAYDIACSMQQVFDLPRTSRDQLAGTLIMNHINNDNLAEVVDVQNYYLGIFRDECQIKIGGKHRKVRCLYLCPRNELPPKPEPRTKWYANMQMEQLSAGYEMDQGPEQRKMTISMILRKSCRD
jgi:hypothetical protein